MYLNIKSNISSSGSFAKSKSGCKVLILQQEIASAVSL